MGLVPGTRLGSYEIVAQIGAGGMGEVYQARDTRLGRVVAIKVLPSALAADPGLRERFDREARIISSFSHPHICALYDVGRQDGVDYLVMEHLDGETLADQLARGPIRLDASIAIARQICDALEAAHDKGIVHRDLKPANIKITSDGTVKVLDFGLAKPHAAAAGGPSHSTAQTMMRSMPGVVVGTAAYMSPEQASGRDVDRSSDVWAFACVLYEMLTGRRAFEGDTAGEVFANLFAGEPDWQRLPPETPAGIRRLLRRSLQKDPKQRLRDIRDARFELDERESGISQNGGDDRFATPARRMAGLGLSALAVAVAIAVVLAPRAFRGTPPLSELRLEINTPPSQSVSLAISPDGATLVFAARSQSQSHLWLRSLDSHVPRPLPGTERASTPFWSPDGRSIGFVADTRLTRMDIDGGSTLTLVSGIPAPLGGSWNTEGTIIFGHNPAGPIFRVSATGGEAVPVTQVEAPQQRGHLFPQFLPDGRHFLFYSTGTPERRGVYVAELGRMNAKRLFDADAPAVYAAASGSLLFNRAGRLMGQGFDPDSLELRGSPWLVAEGVSPDTALTASETGSIAYRTAAADSGQRQLVWVDRAGRELAREVYADTAAYGPHLAPDGRRIAVYRLVNGNMDIWSFESSRRAWERITLGAGDDIYPLWSPDGASMVSGSVRTTSVVDLYQTFLGRTEAREQLLLASAEPKFPVDWSADGRFVLYNTLGRKGGLDLWALPMDGNRTPFEVVQTEFNEGPAAFSPDGGWIAYESNKTGRREIYVRQFPGAGRDFLASTSGGTQVRWSRDGKELFYIAADARLTAVPITVSPDGLTIDFGMPTPLFEVSILTDRVNTFRQQYVVSPDGRSFVMQSLVGEANSSPISVILNWKPK